jgi:hypothetical protein
MISQLEYAPHELALLMPGMTAEEERELQDHIDKHGQFDEIVLLDGKILEGVHRGKVCAKLGKQPRYIEFDELPKSVREAGPLAFVIAKNLKRRHLTTSQRSMIAAELIPAFEKQAEERRLANLKKGDSTRETPKAQICANGEVVRGKSAERAAKTLGVSTRSVESARRILKKSPEKAAALKAGKLTLSKAVSDEAKKKEAKQAREVAITRIKKVCGKALADAVEKGARLKTHKDLVAFTRQSDEDMKSQGGLIEIGWPLKKAQLYKAKNLTLRHTLRDLADRAASEGFSLSINVDHWRFSVTRTKDAA